MFLFLFSVISTCLELARVFLQYPFLSKANASLYSNDSQYSGAISACKNFAFPEKKRRENLIISQTNRLLKSSSA